MQNSLTANQWVAVNILSSVFSQLVLVDNKTDLDAFPCIFFSIK